jgi:hypothetical protein
MLGALLPLALPAAKVFGGLAVAGIAGDLALSGAGSVGRLFSNERGARDRAAFAQAGLNQLMMLGMVPAEGRDASLAVRDQFLADTVGQSSTRMGRIAQQANEAAAFRDIMFGRANLIRQASIQSQPHPLELLAGLRSFTNG